MDKKTTVFVLLAVAMASGLFLWSRLQTISEASKEPVAVDQLAVVWDTSPSVPLNCGGLLGVAENAIKAMHIGKGSRLALITTGGVSTSFEPHLVLQTTIPRQGRAGVLKSGQAQQAFRDEILKACHSFRPAEGSAIFRSVEIALAHLSGMGCGAPNTCALIVSTDLEENANAAIEARVFGRSARKKAPAVLDNARVATTFCGYVQNSGGGGPRNGATALVEGWKGLFKEPVVFRPYCEGSTTTEAALIP